MTRTLAALALLASVLLGAPAQADSTTPAVRVPLQKIGDTVDVEVMLQAPLKAWGIRRAAKFYDAQVDGLTIHTRGTCAARPQAVCSRVVIGNYSSEQMLAISHGLAADWHGFVDYQVDSAGRASSRTIYLNSRYGFSRVVTMHELGHVLGLDHHDGGEGVMVTTDLDPVPSTAELDVLRAAYAPQA